MSSTLIEAPDHADATARLGVDADRANSERKSSAWRWMVLACMLLGISGGFRFWRDHQFARLNTESKDCPFPLADVSKTLGSWRAIDDSEMKLDPEIARIAGSTDHIIRIYADSNTGEKIHVMVLYGLAQDVFCHTPDVCYPASGHQRVSVPNDRDIPIAGFPQMPSTQFRSQIFFQRANPGGDHYSEVYYSFRHGGKWQPDMAGEWKTFRYQPGMFKIQTSREVSAAAASPDAPESKLTQTLVTEIIKDLERRLAAAQSPTAG